MIDTHIYIYNIICIIYNTHPIYKSYLHDINYDASPKAADDF